jgi:hypothetical protein
LGNGSCFDGCKVAGLETSEDFDFILGMNVIRTGDFLLTDNNGLLQVYFKPREAVTSP